MMQPLKILLRWTRHTTRARLVIVTVACFLVCPLCLEAASNTATNWLTLKELLKKWDPVPLAEIQRLAEGGDATAMHYLGYCHAEGRRVPQDPAEGASWYLQAMQAGYIPSANNLGVLYHRGLLGTNDFAKAAYYYRFAAERGLAGSQMNLGFLYRDGRGVPADPKEALRWFRLAASQGHDDAMIQLYLCYWDGKGVERDHAKAMEWLKKAADMANPNAECLMGYRCENPVWEGEGASRHVPKPDLQGALSWYRRSAKQGWAGGQYHLGMMYVYGKGVEMDEARGLELIRAAADQNHEAALGELAKLYAQGIGEPRSDSERPVELLERSGGWKDLQLRYEYGIGTERDLVMAARCFCRRKLGGGWYDSPYELVSLIEYRRPQNLRWVGSSITYSKDGHVQIDGPWYRGDAKGSDDLLRVLSPYLKAAKGDGAAAFRIGELYERGLDTPKSAPSAWAWFSVAAQNGNAGARDKLRVLEKQMSADELQLAQKRRTTILADLKEVAPVLR